MLGAPTTASRSSRKTGPRLPELRRWKRKVTRAGGGRKVTRAGGRRAGGRRAAAEDEGGNAVVPSAREPADGPGRLPGRLSEVLTERGGVRVLLKDPG